MSQSRKTVSVQILDKDYQVACSAEEEVMLTASARHLDSNMRTIRGTGKVVGADRIAVMAALNVTNDLLHGEQSAPANNPELDEKVKGMCKTIDDALHRFRQLQL